MTYPWYMRSFALRTPMFGMLLATSILGAELVGAVVYRDQRTEPTKTPIEDQVRREAVRHEVPDCQRRSRAELKERLRVLDEQLDVAERKLDQAAQQAQQKILDDELVVESPDHPH